MLDERVCPSFTLETYSADEVRHLLDVQDPTASYPEWLGVLVCLAYWDAGEVGIDVAIEWSRCDDYPDPEADVRRVFASVTQGQYTGRQRTLASLIADRNRHDAAARAEREAEALGGYLERIRQAESELAVREIMREAAADEALSRAALGRLAKPIREQVKTGGLGAPTVRETRRELDTLRSELLDAPELAEVGEGDVRRRIIDTVRTGGELYVDQHGAAFVDLEIGGRTVTMPVEGAAFTRYVLGEAMRLGNPIEGRAAKMIADNVAVLAMESPLRRTTAMRVARIAGDDVTGAGDRTYLDHGDDACTVTEISAADGVRKVGLGEVEGVRFVRGDRPAALPQVHPVAREDLAVAVARLWRFVPVAPARRTVLLAAILDALRGGTNKAILVLTGPAGSGKSTAMRCLVDLLDPQQSDLPGPPHRAKDAAALLASSYATAIDNAVGFSEELEVMFCRAATSGADVAQRHYVNLGSIARDIGGPILTTGIEVPFIREDTLDRTIIVPVERAGRGEDPEALRRAFEAERPALLSALCSLLSACLAELPAVELSGEGGHRMVGLEMLGEAIHRVLGVQESFAAALDADGCEARSAALEAYPVAIELVNYLEERHARGETEALEIPPARLLRVLTTRSGRQQGQHGPGWPATPEAFGKLLRRQARALGERGWTLEAGVRRKGERVLRFTANENAPSVKEAKRETQRRIVHEFPELPNLDAAEVLH